jgi:glycosyltransferase involved in cell wall biosynthesis
MKKYLVIGNAESIHLVKWIKELIKYFDVFVLSPKGVHDDVKKIIPEKNIFTLDLAISEMGGNYKLLFKCFTIQKIIRRIDPDYVNAHYITSHGFIAALIKKLGNFHFKLIQSTWGTDILVAPFKNKLYFQITRFTLNQADLITSDSEYMSGIIRTISRKEIMTFIFGLDFLPEIDVSKKDPNLFYSNRMLTENYNIIEVIQLFHLINQLNPDTELIISHDGEQRNYLENLTKELGLQNKVAFIGFISLDKQISLYRRAQFYISLPKSDSTSVSLIEAMAYGCIPVLSDLPANREWVTDGLNGIIYSRTDKDISRIFEALTKKNEMVGINREIIKEKGIFADSIKKFVDRIS